MSYGGQTDIAMICNIKAHVECWTAPRDYHRGDRDSNTALGLRKISKSMQRELKVNLISSKLRLYPISGAPCYKTLTSPEKAFCSVHHTSSQWWS